VVDPTRGKVTVVGSFQTGANGARTVIQENGTFEGFNADGKRTMLMRTAADYSGSVTRFYGPLQAEMLNFYPADSTTLRGQIIQDSANFTLNAAGTSQNLYLDAKQDIVIDPVRYVRSPKIYTDNVLPNGAYTEMYVIVNGTTGRIMRIGANESSEKLKVAIEDDHTDKTILNLQPRKWYWRENAERLADLLSRENSGEEVSKEEWGDVQEPYQDRGFVAEEVASAGLEQYTLKSKETQEISGLKYDRMWIPLVPIAKEHEDRITELERIIAQLQKEKE